MTVSSNVQLQVDLNRITDEHQRGDTAAVIMWHIRKITKLYRIKGIASSHFNGNVITYITDVAAGYVIRDLVVNMTVQYPTRLSRYSVDVEHIGLVVPS